MDRQTAARQKLQGGFRTTRQSGGPFLEVSEEGGGLLSHNWWVVHSGPASGKEKCISKDVTEWEGGPHRAAVFLVYA